MRSHHPMDAIVQKVPLKMIYACEYNASFHLSYSAGLLVRVAAGKVKAVIRPLTVPTTSICEVDLILEWSSGIPLSFFLSFSSTVIECSGLNFRDLSVGRCGLSTNSTDWGW